MLQQRLDLTGRELYILSLKPSSGGHQTRQPPVVWRCLIGVTRWQEKVIRAHIEDGTNPEEGCKVRRAAAPHIVAISTLSQSSTTSHLGIRQLELARSGSQAFGKGLHWNSLFLMRPTASMYVALTYEASYCSETCNLAVAASGPPERNEEQVVVTVLCCLTPPVMAELIAHARSRVAYAAPGLAQNVAVKLAEAHARLGEGAVRTIVDLDPDLSRLGYGELEAVEILREKRVPVATAPGLRIGLLVIDDAGWVFSLPPLLVEEQRSRAEEPNAVRVTVQQVDLLLAAMAIQSAFTGPIGASELLLGGAGLAVDLVTSPPIGTEPASEFEVDRARTELDRSPPQRFDLARRVRVFNSYFEFVELELKGFHVQRHRVALPNILLRLFGEEKTRQRIEATYKLIERSSTLGDTALERKVNDLRACYLAQVPGFGRVIMRARREAFEAEVESLKNQLVAHRGAVACGLDAEIQASRQLLIEDLAAAVYENPPAELQGKLSSRASLEVCRRYVADKLSRTFPTADKLITGMALTCVFKGITYETLTNSDFQRKLREAFPYEDLDGPLREFDAVEGNTIALRRRQSTQEQGSRG